jgi:hypothetical protein
MPNRTEARPAKAAFTNATGRLPLLRLFSTPLTKSQTPTLDDAGGSGGCGWSDPRWTSRSTSKATLGGALKGFWTISRSNGKGLSGASGFTGFGDFDFEIPQKASQPEPSESQCGGGP